MATVMGIRSVGSGVGEKSSSSRKTVRLSVDSGTSENLAENEAALPSLTAAKERVVSVSEIDPGLLLAATIFVQVRRNTELKWLRRRPLSTGLDRRMYCRTGYGIEGAMVCPS